MKRVIFALSSISLSLALTGCADLQNQAGSYLPGASSQQPQAVAMEGGQQVQYIPGTGTGRTANTSYQANTSNGQSGESSFVGDMMKSATDTLKSEASSTVRSTVRGMFSR
jgi:hypothetical protein